jgi:hypothetical protein
MSLVNSQQVLARIYTNSKLRDDFLTNPDVVGNSLGLNCQEIQQLSQLSSQQVNLFASSLKRKRLGEIRKLLPLTNKILKQEFDRLFFSFAETYLPTGSRKHLLDSIAFSIFLKQNLTTEKNQLWLLDIWSYETIRLNMLLGKKQLIWSRFNYQIETLIANVKGNYPSVPSPQPIIGIWFKLTPSSQWRSLFLPLPTFWGQKRQPNPDDYQ